MSREILTRVTCDYCGAEETMVGAVHTALYPGWANLTFGGWDSDNVVINDICDKCLERIGQKAEGKAPHELA